MKNNKLVWAEEPKKTYRSEIERLENRIEDLENEIHILHEMMQAHLKLSRNINLALINSIGNNLQ